ncbi:aminotransferase class I/II-fold pyridoxal phosphate-dependent enzyme [Streptomyces sp. NBC_01233]|uniref:aminotransferase class I/II-fold pyridoxal phosphate-dependent enzyme n=1 Tax=Streptomyces sp. NBC_01233 TaxID=2903787 RepID=UPI002E144BD6|nr:aminotransferase class I/II-fold pyridoxal phosphate-dependent enzyme [Streptomyces sp. NBC_01233]
MSNVQTISETLTRAVALGISHVVAEDDQLDGRTVVIDGKRVLNFSSCSYLGMELHPAIQTAAADSARRYGTQFSMSRTYMSSPEYPAAEAALRRIFDRPTLIAASTTLGSIAFIPTIIRPGADAVLLDAQVHANVQLAAKISQADGTEVQIAPHGNPAVLDRKITELSQRYERVWYMADGLYSMYGDLPPADELNRLFEKHDKLWIYADDAHALSWYGRHGRGWTLENLDPKFHDRAVVVGSLAKSFGVGGGVLTFPTEEMRQTVLECGMPMLFSGPVQPPMIGGIRASAELHMTEEAEERRRTLRSRIRFFNTRATELKLPLVSLSEAPIRLIATGNPEACFGLVRRLLDAGMYTNFATYPAVPANRSGVRVPITVNHTEQDINFLLDTVAEQLPLALEEAGQSFDELKRAFHRQFADRDIALAVVC